MTFDQYQRAARRTQNPALTPTERLLHALHGLAAEVGEIHSIYQKKYQGHTVIKKDIIDELGDLQWFMAELADACGFTLEETAQHNVKKLMARYPDGFEAERSLHRGGGDG